MKPMKTVEMILDCALDVVASQLEQFWSTHEDLSDLSLRRVDGPPMRREYTIIELLTNI